MITVTIGTTLLVAEPVVKPNEPLDYTGTDHCPVCSGVAFRTKSGAAWFCPGCDTAYKWTQLPCPVCKCNLELVVADTLGALVCTKCSVTYQMSDLKE